MHLCIYNYVLIFCFNIIDIFLKIKNMKLILFFRDVVKTILIVCLLIKILFICSFLLKDFKHITTNQSNSRFYILYILKNGTLLFVRALECIYSSIKFVLYLSEIFLVDCFNLIIHGKLNFFNSYNDIRLYHV